MARVALSARFGDKVRVRGSRCPFIVPCQSNDSTQGADRSALGCRMLHGSCGMVSAVRSVLFKLEQNGNFGGSGTGRRATPVLTTGMIGFHGALTQESDVPFSCIYHNHGVESSHRRSFLCLFQLVGPGHPKLNQLMTQSWVRSVLQESCK
jgi:hypothetical protein